jgi:hypothetical protein
MPPAAFLHSLSVVYASARRAIRMRRLEDFQIQTQPDDLSCGPACLHAVYRYFGDELPLTRLLDEIPMLEQGGTLEVLLGIHALHRGYRVTLYTYNLRVFDPTWFRDPGMISAKLRAQIDAHPKPKVALAARHYVDFLALGGEIRFQDLTTALLREPLKRGIPILTGLSATYLHRSAREFPDTNEEDDVLGTPVGHFVVLCGYDAESREVRLADPMEPVPARRTHIYALPIERVMGAILLGVLTYDANLLLIEPGRRSP